MHLRDQDHKIALELYSLRDPALQANYFPFCFVLAFISILKRVKLMSSIELFVWQQMSTSY